MESKASVRTQQSQNQTITEITKTTATSKKDINLRLETLQKNKPDNRRIPKIDDSPQTDSDYVESSDNSYKSPKIKLVIGRKEIKTSDASAITESRLTVYGSQDVDITISSQSSISMTTTQINDGSTSSGDVRDTPKRYKHYTIIEDEIKDEDDDHNRADRKRDESVAFATKKSIHLYGSFDSMNAESPATDPSVSHYITDTGISMARGFTENTSPGLESENLPEESKMPILDTLEVEAEETELTDAGLSPIAADDAEMINNAFQMAADEETHFTTTATSPVEFDEASATSEAATITDKIETKDASSSPLDENIALSISEVPEITDEEILFNRRTTTEVKAKVKILEEQTTKNFSSPKRRVDFEEAPKIEQYVDEKIEGKQTLLELKKIFSPEKSDEGFSIESMPAVQEVIEKMEKHSKTEFVKRERRDLEIVVKQTVEKKDTEEIIKEIESQIVHESDIVIDDHKTHEKKTTTKLFKADKFHIDTENLENIHEPAFEIKMVKKRVADLTEVEECLETTDKNVVKVSESVAAIESKLKEVTAEEIASKRFISDSERNLVVLERADDILSPTDKEIIQIPVAEKIVIFERKISDEENSQIEKITETKIKQQIYEEICKTSTTIQPDEQKHLKSIKSSDNEDQIEDDSDLFKKCVKPKVKVSITPDQSDEEPDEDANTSLVTSSPINKDDSFKPAEKFETSEDFTSSVTKSTVISTVTTVLKETLIDEKQKLDDKKPEPSSQLKLLWIL